MQIETNKIYCGDCLEIMREMDDNSIDMVLTDPPYKSLDSSVCVGTTTRLINTPWFDTMDRAVIMLVVNECMRVLKDTGALYVFADVKTGLELFPQLSPSNVLVWDKGHIGMGYSWRRTHEWAAYCPMEKHRLRRKDYGDILRFSGVKNKFHPTEKPVELMIPIIKNSSDSGDIILDPFMGVGGVMLAALKTNRYFIGIELSPEYCDIAQKRVDAELAQLKLNL